MKKLLALFILILFTSPVLAVQFDGWYTISNLFGWSDYVDNFVVTPDYYYDFDGVNDYVELDKTWTELGVASAEFMLNVQNLDQQQTLFGWDINTANLIYFTNWDLRFFESWEKILYPWDKWTGWHKIKIEFDNGVGRPTLTINDELVRTWSPWTIQNQTFRIWTYYPGLPSDWYLKSDMKDLVLRNLSWDIIANYPMKEASWTGMIDVSWNWNHGTIVNADDTIHAFDKGVLSAVDTLIDLSWDSDREVQPGKYYEFDGVDDYVFIWDDPSFDFVDEISIAGSFKSNTSSVNKYITTKVEDSFYVSIWTDGKLWCFFNGLTPFGWVLSNAIVNDFQNHTFACTYDGQHVKIYIDGDLDTSIVKTWFIAEWNSEVRIGRRDIGYFQGDIYDISYYNRSLTDTEVSSIYNWKNILNGLIAHYKMDEWDGTIAYDSSWNGKHGTIVNADLATFHGEWVDWSDYQNRVGYSDGGLSTELSSNWDMEASVITINWVSPTSSVRWWFELSTDYALDWAQSLRYYGDGITTWEQYIYWQASNIGLVNWKTYQYNVNIYIPSWNTEFIDVGIWLFDGSLNVIDSTTTKWEWVELKWQFTYSGELYLRLFELYAWATNESIYIDKVSLYEIDSTIKVPRDESNTSLDVLGNALQYTGKVKYNASLVESHVANFDGLEDYVDLWTEVLFDVNEPLTFTFWSNVQSDYTGSSKYPTPVSLMTNSPNNQTLFFAFSDNATSYNWITFGSAIDFPHLRLTSLSWWYFQNSYHHVAFVYNGQWYADQANYKIYVDGNEIGLTTAWSYTSFPNTINRLWKTDRTTDYFKWQLYDIQIARTEASLEDIQKVMNGWKLNNILRHFPLAEWSGDEIYDVSWNWWHGNIVDTNTTFRSETQDNYHYNLMYGFTLSGAKIPGMIWSGNDVLWNVLTNPAGQLHNGAETKIKLPAAPELVNIDSWFRYDWSWTPLAKWYNDFMGLIHQTTYTKATNQLSNITLMTSDPSLQGYLFGYDTSIFDNDWSDTLLDLGKAYKVFWQWTNQEGKILTSFWEFKTTQDDIEFYIIPYDQSVWKYGIIE